MNPYIIPGIPKKFDEFVACVFEVDVRSLYSKSRLRNDTEARHFAMWYRIKLNGETTVDVGKAYKRDHATAIHACKKVEELMEVDKAFKIKAAKALKQLEKFKK